MNNDQANARGYNFEENRENWIWAGYSPEINGDKKVPQKTRGFPL